MVQHATAALQPHAAAAGLQKLQQALSSSSSSGGGGARGVLLAVSHKVAGDLALAQVREQQLTTGSWQLAVGKAQSHNSVAGARCD
jgi:hypothetical protein